VLLAVTPLRDATGLTTGYLGVSRDITERKQAEDALRRAHDVLDERVRERTADLLAAQAMAHLGSWEWDIHTGVERWSDELFRIFGYEPHGIMPSYDTFIHALHPEDCERVLTAVNATLNLNTPYDFACRIRRPTGEVREIECRGEVTRDETSRPIRMVGTVLDITERTRSEQTRAHLAAIVTASDDAIVGESLDGIILSWNAAAERISGYSAEAVIGRPLIDILPPESIDLERTILARVGRGESITPHEDVRVRKDGTVVYVSVTVFPIKDRDGRVIGLSRFVRDITARKRADEQLRKAERLAEFGTLASGLAHEIGTPMNVILGRAEYMMSRATDEPSKRGLHTIVSQVERITKLIQQLLNVTRRRPVELRAFDLRQAIHGTVELFREHAARYRTVLELACAEDCPSVLADPDQLSQVLINLITNAIHAMPDGGNIRISLRSVDGKAVLSVADTGQGIAPDHLPKIFDAFFTTKETGKGTGLGLSVVKRIIEEHQGSIAVDSKPGRGTTFTVHLPLS
jgi:PAS domain S-box-containing protein